MSQTFLVMAAGAVGACVGSFLNVVAYRLPLEDPRSRSLGGRSRCPACGKQIPWYHNLPLVAYAWLRGVARCCGARISIRYPLVEAVTAALFVALAVAGRYTPWTDAHGILWTNVAGYLLQATFVAMLVAATCIDISHRILPDAITKPGMALGIAGAFAVPGLAGRFDADITPAMSSALYSACGAAVGALVTWLVRVLARAAFRKEAMGLGDVKFLGMIGAFVGWPGALLTFFLASVVGAAGGVVHRWITKDAYVPFGPFLAVGALLTLFFEDPILVFLFETWPEWQRGSPTASLLLSAAALVSILVLMLLARRGRERNDPR